MATKMTNKNALTYVLDTFGADLPADVAEKMLTPEELEDYLSEDE